MPTQVKQSKPATAKRPSVSTRSRAKTQKLPEVSTEEPLTKEILLTSLAEDSSSPSTNDIAKRAYEIWEEEGCPSGCEEQHWIQAEDELR